MLLKKFTNPQLPTEIKSLQLLKPRFLLSDKFIRQKEQLYTGYQGEVIFYNCLKETVPSSAIIVNNLTMSYDHSPFQIDSLLILDNKIYLFEVKNYKGEFIIEEDKWFNARNKNEISNPFNQLSRTRYLFDKLLQQQFTFKLEPYLVFINDEFTLYHAPMNNRIVYPTQLPRFLQSLSHYSFKRESHHHKLVQYLIENDISDTIAYNKPSYTFQQLKKGIFCRKCGSQLERYNEKNVVCKFCQETYRNNNIIANSIEELLLLFPEKKITTDLVYQWTKGFVSKMTIRRFLNKHFKRKGTNRNTHYVIDENILNKKTTDIHFY